LYDGPLPVEADVLTLNTVGPAMKGTGMCKYRDTIEFQGSDHRLLRSFMQGDDGKWHEFLCVSYRRVK